MARPVDRDDIEFETKENVAHTGADGYFMIKCLKTEHVDDGVGMEQLKIYEKGVQSRTTRKRKLSKTRTRSRRRCRGGVCKTIRRIIRPSIIGLAPPLPPPKNLFIIDCSLLITSSIFGGVGPFLNPPFPLPPPPGGVPHGL